MLDVFSTPATKRQSSSRSTTPQRHRHPKIHKSADLDIKSISMVHTTHHSFPRYSTIVPSALGNTSLLTSLLFSISLSHFLPLVLSLHFLPFTPKFSRKMSFQICTYVLEVPSPFGNIDGLGRDGGAILSGLMCLICVVCVMYLVLLDDEMVAARTKSRWKQSIRFILGYRDYSR